MSNFVELTLANIATNVWPIAVMTGSTVVMLAVGGLLHALKKPILKQYEREDAGKLWEEVVCSGFEDIPSTNAGGDIKK